MIEELIALMKIAMEYVAAQKGTLDFARFKPNARVLLDKYVKYQLVSTLHITHFYLAWERASGFHCQRAVERA